MLCDAGIGQLQEDFCVAFQDVEQVRALVALPDQILPIAEGALCQAWLQYLQQVVLRAPQGVLSLCQKARRTPPGRQRWLGELLKRCPFDVSYCATRDMTKQFAGNEWQAAQCLASDI